MNCWSLSSQQKTKKNVCASPCFQHGTDARRRGVPLNVARIFPVERTFFHSASSQFRRSWRPWRATVAHGCHVRRSRCSYAFSGLAVPTIPYGSHVTTGQSNLESGRKNCYSFLGLTLPAISMPDRWPSLFCHVGQEEDDCSSDSYKF
jgi:hypothetical protein